MHLAVATNDAKVPSNPHCTSLHQRLGTLFTQANTLFTQSQMCLLTIATGASRRFPIIILNNRDEYVSRSTSRLTLFGACGQPLPSSTASADGAPVCGAPAPAPEPSASSVSSASSTDAAQRANLLCAIDTSIPNGGTWMGVNVRTGAFAAVTNSPQCASQAFHIPTVAPSRAALSAASPSFDMVAYLARVLLGEGAGAGARSPTSPSSPSGRPLPSASGDGCCGLNPSASAETNDAAGNAKDAATLARPFLKFMPERSRGCIVGEYLSGSEWARSAGGEGSARWASVLPSNIQPPKPFGQPHSDSLANDADLYYDGYNLVCGNLVGIAEELRHGAAEKARKEKVEHLAVGDGPFGDGRRFLYSTNRQQPFPLGRRHRHGEGGEASSEMAPAYSATWAALAEKGPAPLDCMLLAEQPSLSLGDGSASASSSPISRLTVDTVANTFLNNPIEPKSAHLTASVRRALEGLFGNENDGGCGDSSDASSLSVEETLLPALAACLCERPQIEIDISPGGRNEGLLAIAPMAGLSPEEHRVAVEEELRNRLPALVGKLRAAAAADKEKGKGERTADQCDGRTSVAERLAAVIVADLPAAVSAVASDIIAARAAMAPLVAVEEREVHRNVYTHLSRGAVGAGVFKTRTQTVAILEDLGAEADDSTPHRYRLHYYLRDTETHEQHAPWQRFCVDLPVPE